MGYIKGNYRKTIFRSDQGFVIGLFKVKETDMEVMNEYINKVITFTGYFSELNTDDTYIMYGEETMHPKFGFQFSVKEYERMKPVGIDGIVEFLSSDLFPGIGENLAKSVAHVLGDNALDMILNDASCLNLVPKITSKKIDVIYNNLVKYEESHKTIVYLTELGFNMKDALVIYNTYHENTISEIENNIYKLVDDITDISFLKVDDLASKLEVSKDDYNRIKAGIIYVMENMTFQSGNTYLFINDIYNKIINTLRVEIPYDTFNSLIDELISMDKVVLEDDKYYLKNIYVAEANVASKLYKLASNNTTKHKRIDNYIEELENANDIIYDVNQKRAIKKALENNVLIITGGPGTGKTTIIKAIVELYSMIYKMDEDELIETMALLAPTGRASKRMSEATLYPASTIHRFLKWNKDDNTFSINEYNKDNSYLIIVDEVSMIDISLLDNLLKGLTDNIKLIMVGDYNQLPSVGPGQVLKDLIDSDVIDTVKLNLLYRQDVDSFIPTLAHEIKEGMLQEDFIEPRSDYNFIECSPQQIVPALQKLCEKIIEKGLEKKVQLMAPIYHGDNGIDRLNIALQEVFNPQSETKEEIIYGDVIYRENDKVLQLVNVPDLNVYNGDIGYIKKISQSKKTEIEIDFDGNIVKYHLKDLGHIKHGYIISIHKSQGSEFDTVIIPICNSYRRMLYKKLIYTGITRAKKKLILVGESNAFGYAVFNNAEYDRNTSLKDKLLLLMHNSIKNS